MTHHIQDPKRRLQELSVLHQELSTVKKTARVYKQQPNSQIFIKEDRARVMHEAKKEMDQLIAEYGSLDTNTSPTTTKANDLER